jgi:SAM-dependent methyltransferase
MLNTSDDVKSFYFELPFNYAGTPDSVAKQIKSVNSLKQYNGLDQLLKSRFFKKNILDVGCGPGWLVLNMDFHYQVNVTGIDISPVAIDRAISTAKILGSSASFVNEDIFSYRANKKFALITSIGVLHHTSDCLAAIKYIVENFLEVGGVLYLGLYHSYGRKPFLDHFKKMKMNGSSRDDLLKEYEILDPRFMGDPKHLNSWFRDQVEHPHETQHTLAELTPLFDDLSLKFLGTSLSKFSGNHEDFDSILNNEHLYEDFAIKKLRDRVYCPGFFTVWGEKL